jgi:hypothetical protein
MDAEWIIMHRKSLDRLLEWWLRGERRKEASRGISTSLYIKYYKHGGIQKKDRRETLA